jgi:hypothetical protein
MTCRTFVKNLSFSKKKKKTEKYFPFLLYIYLSYKKIQKHFPNFLLNKINIKKQPPKTKAEHLPTGGVNINKFPNQRSNLPLYHLRFGKLLNDKQTLRGVETV